MLKEDGIILLRDGHPLTEEDQMALDDLPLDTATAVELDDRNNCGCSLEEATQAVERAEVEVTEAVSKLETAERNLERAKDDLKKAEARCREVEVKVDGHPKRVMAGTYLVSAFKVLVGVAADRELDILEHGTFRPLDDNAEITICGHEVFVSHVRTGGSS